MHSTSFSKAQCTCTGRSSSSFINSISGRRGPCANQREWATTRLAGSNPSSSSSSCPCPCPCPCLGSLTTRLLNTVLHAPVYYHRELHNKYHDIYVPDAKNVLRLRNRTDVNVLKVLESASIFKTGTVQVVASVYGYGKVAYVQYVLQTFRRRTDYESQLTITAYRHIIVLMLTLSPTSHT